MKKSDAEELVNSVLSSRKNANKIVDVINMLSADQSEEVLVITLHGVREFFSSLIKYNELQQKKPSSEMDTMERYRIWSQARYEDCIAHILELFSHESIQVKELCFTVVFQLMKKEIESSCGGSGEGYQFPESLLNKLVEKMVESDDVNPLVKFAKKYWELDDVRFFALKCLFNCMNEMNKRESSDKTVMYNNVFHLLKSLSQCMRKEIKEEQDNVLAKVTSTSKKMLAVKEQKRLFSNLWLEFLNLDLNTGLFKNVLTIIHKDIIPHFSSPCLLADFLTRSLKQGGGISLLALHGLFILMNDHNLEYPEFYTHLYSMVHPRIFHAKYRARFFYLLNIFLMSSHLPAYLIAAFAKKLARLSLVAPTNALQLIVTFVFNLLERHPSIQVLRNRKLQGNKGSDLQNDPFSASETDPALCKAMESSLWEIQTLQKHYSPVVVEAVNKSYNCKTEQDIDGLLEITYEEMFNSKIEKNVKEAAMNYKSPETLFGGFEDSVANLWNV